jgi:adenylate cyclase
LAKFGWLFVIARNSSFTFRGKAVDVRLVSRELGVRYVLEGSVRRAGNRIRVTAQLIDATTGAHVWAARYDCDLSDIFAVQDEITAIATAIAPAIINAVQQRVLTKSPERLDAWEAYHRGTWHFAMGNRESVTIARDFFQKAVDLDPNFASGYAALAGVATLSGSLYYMISLDEAARTAEQLARKALSLDPSDAFAHARLAAAMQGAGELEGCISECNEALSLDGNCALAHGVKGMRPKGNRVALTVRHVPVWLKPDQFDLVADT